MKFWAVLTLFASARGAVVATDSPASVIGRANPYVAPFQTTVHPFGSPPANICAYESGPQKAENAIVLIAGRGGGPHTMSVANEISKALLSAPELGYSLFEVRMRSSLGTYGSFGTAEDIEDISALVEYLRKLGREKIVLLGHSTGCQDIIKYSMLKDKVPSVDGFILQGPISDREAFEHVLVKRDEMDSYHKALEYAKLAAHDAQYRAGDDILGWMPRWFMPEVIRNTPFTISRFHSLLNVGGGDDLFSSDLSSKAVSKVWTSLAKPAMVLHSGKDELVPDFVNKEELISEWKAAAGSKVSDLSGVIPDADHVISESGPAAWFCDRVVKFLQAL
ncbi:hypothetical protein CFO_g2233 [Ceratocystis platani]|uniref:Uncharacterized protein n=1 Tax=Ceratocystis fimbriata f. sp. platani TaxID=88771 RepID=A0A0F8B236_CERFI|nr:hypothetical protein CFO_g2233 [Ceratocystis platani]